jgi:hypothetical protein
MPPITTMIARIGQYAKAGQKRHYCPHCTLPKLAEMECSSMATNNDPRVQVAGGGQNSSAS